MITKMTNVDNDIKTNAKTWDDRVRDLVVKAKTGDYKIDYATYSADINRLYSSLTRQSLLLTRIRDLKETNKRFTTYDTIILDKAIDALTSGSDADFQTLFELRDNGAKGTMVYNIKNITISTEYPRTKSSELLFIINLLGLKETAFFLACLHKLLR